jgi:hypothetical protein
MAAMKGWDVYLNGKKIDTVFYDNEPPMAAEDIKRSLVNHDGYDDRIEVKAARKSRKK